MFGWFIHRSPDKEPKFEFTAAPKLEFNETERLLFNCLTTDEQHEVAQRYFLPESVTISAFMREVIPTNWVLEAQKRWDATN